MRAFCLTFDTNTTPDSTSLVLLATGLAGVAAARYDWNAFKLHSPALPRFTPKLNLGDACRVHVVHVTRHAKQIERLVGKVG